MKKIQLAKEKILDISLILGAAAAIFTSLAFNFAQNCEEMQDKAFRLHILANSDSSADQEIKYALRDYIINDMGYIFRSCETKDETVMLASRDLPLISERANEFLEHSGCDYRAECTVEKCSFPTRRYGDYILPAGEYDALRIVLGEGKGHNWWCVLFPSVCLPAAAEKNILPTREFYEEQKLRAKMTADSLAVESGRGIEVKFAVYEWLRVVFGF